MAELTLCLLLVGIAGVFWGLNPRARKNALMLWVTGWVVFLSHALFLLQFRDEIWASYLSHFFGPLLPVFLLSGALVYADRRLPAWLIPAAIAFGFLRLSVASAGNAPLAHSLAMGLEPGAELVAAVLVFQAIRGRPASISQYLLAPCLVGVALVDGGASVWALRGAPLADPVIWSWAAIGPLAAGIQIAAASQQRLQESRRRRIRATEELNESEERYRALTENAFDLIAETDSDGRLTYVNSRFEEVLGCARETLIGKFFSELVDPTDRECATRWYHDLIAGGSAKPTTARLRHADGSWRWVESTASVFRTADGAQRVVLCSRDVTERIQLEETLRDGRERLENRVTERTAELVEAVGNLEQEVAARIRLQQELVASEERYRTISELSSDLSFGYILKADGVFIRNWVTQAFKAITGYHPEELEERGWEVLTHPDDLQLVNESVMAARRGESRELEARIVTKAGEVRWMHTRISSIRSESDGSLQVVGASRDITERKRAQEERQQLETHMRDVQRLESLGVLAGGMAHDFNNQLGVILGNSSLVRMDLPVDSPLHQRLARIQTAAKHAAGLTDQMLTYAGRAAVTLKPLNLPQLVGGMLELLQASISKRCKLVTELSPTLPPVDGDATQLRQVMVNLVTNASEALAGESGEIFLRTGTMRADSAYLADTYGTSDLEEAEYVYLEVEDSGSGVSEEIRARIFEPFYTTKASGRGLGLPAVLGIVQAHRGAIKLTSTMGQGATFRALFPIAKWSVVSPREPADTVEASTQTGTVLVIDDEEAVREVAQLFLERNGFQVLTATGGRDGIEIFRARAAEIDAVVLDLSMPDIDGHETFRTLNAISAETPVILASGYHEEQSAKGFPSGAIAGFVKKPYEAEELTNRVRSALRT